MLCAARTAAKAQDVAAAEGGSTLALRVGLEQSDLVSVKLYLDALHSEFPNGVEGALLCAGVEALPLTRSVQGFESTFAINTLSHFVIAVELAAAAAAAQRPLRIVSVTSSAAFDSRLGEADALDLSWEQRPYNARQAYVDSKACNILIADMLQRRATRGERIVACSADPGPTASMLLRNALPQRAAQRATMTDEQLVRQARQLSLRTPAQAARGLVWCLTSPECAPGSLYVGAAAPPGSEPPVPTWQSPLPWRSEALATAVWAECGRMADPWLSPLARKWLV